MSELLLQKTDTARWLSLISEAEEATGRRLDEDSESYLVFLLIRHADDSELPSRVMGLDYLQGLQLPKAQRHQRLRDVGDRCLLFSGFFPQQAERRRVRLSYFIDLGRSAYQEIADGCHQAMSGVYRQLSHEFLSLMEILQGIRGLHGRSLEISPMTAFDLWQETGSRHALDGLTQAIPIDTGHPRQPRGLRRRH